MNDKDSTEQARAVLRKAIDEGLLPEDINLGCDPIKIVEAAMAGTIFYGGVYAPGGVEPQSAILLDIHPDDLTWTVILADIEERVLEMTPGRTKALIERLILLKREIHGGEQRA